ncbi:Inner membrane protein of type IV secretion of T-DNA complex, VirB6 [Candidatus Burkholderia verschuerenii]|uniref:Inner membrane protein of type IV secretion of T-DNA complex, VirB6 n=1 Tax=Candidatus Burkholderia verschuerenii TaxID=242163 RepID=A0A0L0ME76_9BURK|nr:type IV secretion system protein [Candidatus Burkholderia verschuerenii]KND60586.1 Inner membrane protein of type IV secretion of T-DNA complex, VirB6 [Candidatus Burkholderia verschuerenii]
MNFTLFSDLFQQIDSTTNTFVSTISSNVVTAAMPVITAGLTVTFIFYGLLVARGAVEDSIRDFVFKCFKIGMIVSIASAGGLYQTQIADAIQKTPDEFATMLLPASAGQVQGNAAADLVDKAAGAGFDKAGDAFNKAATWNIGGAVSFGAFGVLCTLATAFLTAIGGAFILLAKIALAILAGLGPLFILALLFKSTSRFFEAWCGQVLTYGLTVLLVSSVFGLMMQLYTGFMDKVQLDGSFSFAYSLGGCVILSIACILIVIQLPSIAAGLANGVGIGLWHELRVAKGVGGAGVGAVRGAISAPGRGHQRR